MNPDNDFDRAAQQEGRFPMLADLWCWTRAKWWVLIILIPLLLFGAMILLSGTGLAPFIYTLF